MDSPCSEAIVIVFQTVPVVCIKRKRKMREMIREMQDKE